MPATLIALSVRHAIEPASPVLHIAAGQMAMIGSGRAIAGRSMYAISRRAGAALHASAEARWAAGALLLAGLIYVAVTLDMRFGMLNRLTRPALIKEDVTPEAAVLGTSELAGTRVQIPGPNDVDSRRVVSFQPSGASRQPAYTLTFADHHVLTMTRAQAAEIIEKQTGKSPEQLSKDASERSQATP